MNIKITVLLAVVFHFATLADADGVEHKQPSATAAELAVELSETQQQLRDVRRQLDELRIDNAAHQPVDSRRSDLRRLPASITEDSTSTSEQLLEDVAVTPASLMVTPASYSGSACGDGCAAGCADFGAAACPGVSQYCGKCLEGLSWNKAGGWKIVPFGRLRGEAIYSEEPNAGEAVVVFLNPKNQGIDEDIMTLHAKQSQINFAISGPNVGSFQTGGVIMTNFMGPQPLRNFSGANIVLAYGELKSDEWRFSFGRMLDLFGPINPSSVNQIAQRGTGNVGIYRGAFSLDRYIAVSDQAKWTMSGRVSQQDISDYASIPAINGKDNGLPNFEGRIGLELGPMMDFGRPLDIGVSGVVGEIQAVAPTTIGPNGSILRALDEIEQTRAVALDVQLHGERMGVRAEAFWSRAAGTYFAGVLQSLNPETAQAIESVGGWGEVYYRLNPCTTMNLGFGVDDPRNADLGFIDRDNVGIGQISYNEVAWLNTIWNVTDFFELALEVSHRRTRYIALDAAADGLLFHFASTFTF